MNFKILLYYGLSTKLVEGNVFSRVCNSVGWGTLHRDSVLPPSPQPSIQRLNHTSLLALLCVNDPSSGHLIFLNLFTAQ